MLPSLTTAEWWYLGAGGEPIVKALKNMKIWAASWQNQQTGLIAQRRLRSARASAQSDQSLCCLLKKAWFLSYPFSAHRRLWSDWADAQADLSLHWVHSHFVGFVMRWLNYINIWAAHVKRVYVLITQANSKKLRWACTISPEPSLLRCSLTQ